ncbi:MAG: peptidoglycan editing factor PgeF [Rhodothermia bacterium]|nr:peptidoglycan editing factor PgeF [Rhodothermia bacterium]
MNTSNDRQFVAVPAIFDRPGLTAGFSKRHGGTSVGQYQSLNVGLSTGDDPAAVLRNRELLFGALHLDPSRVAIAGQVHGAAVRYVESPGVYSGFDALITDVSDLAVAITAADCAVVLVAEEERGIVGAIHSGWRGTVSGIVVNTVEEMERRGADPKRMRAYVSPCISAERFEVGEEVAALFPSQFVVRRDEWRRPHIDLRDYISAQLISMGISLPNVEVSEECTYDHPDYFSYRAESGNTGRMMGFIALTNRSDRNRR